MKNRKPQSQPQPGQVRLDRLVRKSHPIAKAADLIDWDAIERDLGQRLPSDGGGACIPFRLAAGILLLKHAFGHSDDEALDHWGRDPYYQHFCGGEVYVHEALVSKAALSNWRKRIGEEGIERIIRAASDLPHRIQARSNSL